MLQVMGSQRVRRDLVTEQQNICTREEGLPWWLSHKESACNAGDAGSIPRSGRSSGEQNDDRPLHSCLGNPMERGSCQVTVHGVTELVMNEHLSMSILFQIILPHPLLQNIVQSSLGYTVGPY